LLVGAVALLVPGLVRLGVANDPLWIATGWLAIFGAAGTAIQGFFYKISTFLVWLKRYGPIAGKIIAGAEGESNLWIISPNGDATTVQVGSPTPVAIEDIDIVMPGENFFGVNFGTSRLLGATAANCRSMIGDILLTTETVTPGTSGLFRLQWNGTALTADPVPLGATSAPVGQWEHTTFANASIVEIQ
jgi:hypothetical protein